MTKQEIFNKVSNHLTKQNAVSKKNGSCAYRGEDRHMCAVGCLIPNELYKTNMENATPYSGLLDKVLETIGMESDKGKMFLRDLQLIHDSHDPPYWKKHLRDFAERYELTTPECILEEESNQ